MDRTRFSHWCILSVATAISTGCDISAPPAGAPAQIAQQQPQLLDTTGKTAHKARRKTSRIVPAAYPSEEDREAWAPDEVRISPLTTHDVEPGNDDQAELLDHEPALSEIDADGSVRDADDEQSAYDAERDAEQQPIERQSIKVREPEGDAPEYPSYTADAEGVSIARSVRVSEPRMPDLLGDEAYEQGRDESRLHLLDAAAGDARPLDDPRRARPSAAAPPYHSNRDASQGVSLPWANARPYSPEMNAVLARADELTRHGFDLAKRGASYSARARFTQSLQLIAQAQDAQQETRLYTKSLSAGLTALKESHDFVANTSAVREINLGDLVRSHRTIVLKQQNLANETAMSAVRQYYNFAQEQLALAAGSEAAGSMALYGLGKLALTGGKPGPTEVETTAQAMVYLQASMLVDDRNFRAANELGVLLARCGKADRAKEMFLRSLAVSQQPAVWHNLSRVHERLGEKQLAMSAQQQTGSTGFTPNAPPVRWIDPSTFAKSTPPSEGLTPPTPANNAPTTAAVPPAPPAAQKKSLSEWLPWSKPAQR